MGVGQSKADKPQDSKSSKKDDIVGQSQALAKEKQLRSVQMQQGVQVLSNKGDAKGQGPSLPKLVGQLKSGQDTAAGGVASPGSIKPTNKGDVISQDQTLPKEEGQLKSGLSTAAGSVVTHVNPRDKADYERRLLQLCIEGKADISQFMQLLRQGLDLNIYDKDGRHPLWRVSFHGREDLVLLFLEHKAIVDLPTNTELGETALITASYRGHLECATVLLKHRANVNYQRKLEGDTPLIRACGKGHLKLAILLIEHGAVIDYVNKRGLTALYYSCGANHPKVVTMLLDRGADINKGEQAPLYGASEGGYLPIVEILVSRGARIDQPCDGEYAATSLLAACGLNHIKVASCLIQKGANINIQNKNGTTPIHYACKKGHINVARLLIKSQANLDITNNDGETPLDVARKYGYSEIVHLLEEKADHIRSSTKEESSSDIQTDEAKPSDTASVEAQAGEATQPESTSDHEESAIEEKSREREGNSTVPSGHVLTRQELQVLGTLLATYSDEKLKEIRLSFEEKQKIKDISREEVEKSLRQCGLSSMADGLKDNIEKDDQGIN